MVYLLLAGFIIRIVIAVFTVNWDFLRITQITLNYSAGGLEKIYEDPLSLYPVLTYWTRYFLIYLTRPFLGASISGWNKSGDLAILYDPFIFRNLFFLKLPFILIELSTAFIFSRLLTGRAKKSFLVIWMTSPVALYSIAAFTNVDVFPIFFLALSIFFLNKKRSLPGAFLLGVATAYKLFPLLLLPFLLFSIKNIMKRLKHLLFFLIPVIGTQIPVFGLPQYWKNSFSAGANRLILASTINIGNNKVLILFIVFYCLILFHFITDRKNNKKVNLYFFLVLSLIFSVSAFNIQWVYWLLPFIIYYQIFFEREKTVVYILNLAYLGIILFSQAGLNIGMFSPIEPSFWTINNPLLTVINRETNILIINTCYSLFAASVIFMAVRIYREKGEEIFINEKA